MPNTIRPPALPDAQNQHPQALMDAPRQGPTTRSSSQRAALRSDRLAANATSWRVVTPQQRFVTAPQALSRRRAYLLSAEALVRIQRAHSALHAATSNTRMRPDVRTRDLLVDADLDPATPTPQTPQTTVATDLQAGPLLPPRGHVSAPESTFAGRTMQEAYDAYALAARMLQTLQPNAESRLQTQAAPLTSGELTVGLAAFDDANLGQRAVRRNFGAGLQPPRSMSAYVASLNDMSAELAASLPSRGSPHLAIIEALRNVSRWHAQLPANLVIELTPAQAQTHQCLISHEPFDKLEHPVGVYTGGVMHVFESVALLTWMKHQTQPRASDSFSPRVATHPMSREPLHLASLRRVQLRASDEV